VAIYTRTSSNLVFRRYRFCNEKNRNTIDALFIFNSLSRCVYKSIITVAEFFTTSHSSLSITNELNFIRDTLITKIVSIKKKPLAPVVVTDFSWALINAVINSLNKCSILQYLNWSFDYLVLKKQNLANVMPVILYLCAVHFLRIMSGELNIICLL
jgi:hypothetical protein